MAMIIKEQCSFVPRVALCDSRRQTERRLAIAAIHWRLASHDSGDGRVNRRSIEGWAISWDHQTSGVIKDEMQQDLGGGRSGCGLACGRRVFTVSVLCFFSRWSEMVLTQCDSRGVLWMSNWWQAWTNDRSNHDSHNCSHVCSTSKWARSSAYFGEPMVHMTTPHSALNCLVNFPPSGNQIDNSAPQLSFSKNNQLIRVTMQSTRVWD